MSVVYLLRVHTRLRIILWWLGYGLWCTVHPPPLTPPPPHCSGLLTGSGRFSYVSGPEHAVHADAAPAGLGARPGKQAPNRRG
jgi:hypothetical protein